MEAQGRCSEKRVITIESSHFLGHLGGRDRHHANPDDQVDEEEALDEDGDGVGRQPGEQLIRPAPRGGEQQEEVGGEEQEEDDELHQNVLVPGGGEQPLGDLGDHHDGGAGDPPGPGESAQQPPRRCRGGRWPGGVGGSRSSTTTGTPYPPSSYPHPTPFLMLKFPRVERLSLHYSGRVRLTL